MRLVYMCQHVLWQVTCSPQLRKRFLTRLYIANNKFLIVAIVRYRFVKHEWIHELVCSRLVVLYENIYLSKALSTSQIHQEIYTGL